jgi:hypothetical protein
LIFFTNGTPVTLSVFGLNFTAAQGLMFLPSSYDVFSFSAVPTHFYWVGK